MDFRVIYYHRLSFPSGSGQTIAVIRDYFELSKHVGWVDLFYRAEAALAGDGLAQALATHGAQPTSAFALHCIPNGWFGKTRLRRQVTQLVRADNIPVVIVVRAFAQAQAAIAIRTLVDRPTVRVVMELHENPFPYLRWQEMGRKVKAAVSRQRAGWIYGNVDAAVCTAQPQIAYFQALSKGKTPTWLHPNGYPDLLFETDTGDQLRPNDGRFHLAYAGRLSAWKNPEVMMAALQYLPKQFVLEIAGGRLGEDDATRAALVQKAAEFGVAERVTYHGFLDPVKVPAFLRAADCLILPLGNTLEARLFTSPMKLFEYAASGVPMVVTRHPSTESLVQDGKQVLMVPAEDAEAMARAVQRIADDCTWAGQLASAAKTWVADHSLARRAERYCEKLATLF